MLQGWRFVTNFYNFPLDGNTLFTAGAYDAAIGKANLDFT